MPIFWVVILIITSFISGIIFYATFRSFIVKKFNAMDEWR